MSDEIYKWYDILGKFPDYEGETENDELDLQWYRADCGLGNPLPS